MEECEHAIGEEQPFEKYLGHWELLQRIGFGAFGEVFRAIDTRDGKEVAVKIEANRGIKHPHLAKERDMYKELIGVRQIPKIWEYRRLRITENGVVTLKSVMAMELMGPNLEDIFKQRKREFSLKTILIIARQMLYILEDIHGRGIIHRDIKPSNIAIGGTPETRNLIYLLDFGLAKFYIDPRTGKHIPWRNQKVKIAGTPRFISVKTHEGVEQSRKDDLECLGYTLLYFITRGKLPWSRIKCNNLKERDFKIYQCKKEVTPSLLETLPIVFKKYFQMVWGLSFAQEPDYHALRRIFTNHYKQEGYSIEDMWMWE